MLVLGLRAAARAPSDPAARTRTAGLVLVAVMLASPSFWEHHAVVAVLLLPPVVQTWRARRVRRLAVVAFASMLLFLAVPFWSDLGDVAVIGRSADRFAWVRIAGAPLGALLLLWGAAFLAAGRGARPEGLEGAS